MANDSAHPTQTFLLDSSTTSITTAWVTVSSSLSASTSVAELFNSTTSFFEFGITSANIVIPMRIFPSGGNGRIGLLLDSGAVLRVRAVNSTASSGVLAINIFR